MKSIFGLILVFLLSVTVSAQTGTIKTSAYATAIFYRAFIPKMHAPIKKVPIYINDILVHELKANTTFTTKILAGKNQSIAIDRKGETAVSARFQADSIYYFKCEVLDGLWFGKPAFHQVSFDIGSTECEVLEIKTAKTK